jgi:hypothetical protein
MRDQNGEEIFPITEIVIKLRESLECEIYSGGWKLSAVLDFSVATLKGDQSKVQTIRYVPSSINHL